MVIKRREKTLSPKEAIELAKKELAPFWVGSEPLIAAVGNGSGQVTAYPLDPLLSTQPWLAFFVDPCSLTFTSVFEVAREWARRYEPQKLGVLLVLESRYAFAQERPWLLRMGELAAGSGNIVVVADRGGLLATAFGAAVLPKILFLQGGQKVFEKSGQDWFAGVEVELQKSFRKTDPGLPLFPPGTASKDLASEARVIELGGTASAQGVKLEGNWARDGEKIWTNDPNATLSFESPDSRVGWVARSALHESAPGETTEVFVEIDGRDVAKESLGDADLSGRVVRVGQVRLYRALRHLPSTHRAITLKFPSADRVGIELFSLRLGN